MLKTIEAILDENGTIHLSESIDIKTARRVLVTVLDESPIISANEEALLSEDVLSQDWEKDEEDDAWSYLR